jgi:uncharacterized protein
MPKSLIVAGYSARALALSAARSGFAPLAIDMFGDLDTRAVSVATVKVAGGLEIGIDADALFRAVEVFVRDYQPVGLVYGSAFDHTPATVMSLGEKVRIFGNESETVRRAKDPLELTRVCERLGVACPQVSMTRPENPEGWLAKLCGGAGGAHVHSARPGRSLSGDWYYQRHISGRPISALFLADGGSAQLVGYSLQWTAPMTGAPFRYGGASGPMPIEPGPAAAMFHAIDSLTRALGLKGLNSADFLVSDEAAHLIDLNPRPGATLDVFDSAEDPLVARHIAACEGRSGPRPDFRNVRAAEIVYASASVVVGDANGWPGWLVDRSPPGTTIPADAPLCTILAEGPNVEAARAAASERVRQATTIIRGESA